jgi:acyl-CoA hydrolase
LQIFSSDPSLGAPSAPSEPDSGGPAVFRTGSTVHLDEWVAPDICDELGFLRPGKILEWMDVVGVLAATRHCARPVVTASVDGMELSQPIRVGERVSMTASVAFTSSRSMGVCIQVTSGLKAETRQTVNAYITFVAVDDDGRPMPVPTFVPQTPQEQAHFLEGKLRHDLRKKLTAGGHEDVLRRLLEEEVPGEERTIAIREALKLLPRVKLPWAMDVPRRPDQSYIHKIEPVRGGTLNFHGTLYGGTLMRWLETAAQLSARSYLDGAPVELSSLHGLTFMRPVRPHVFVHVRASVVHTNADSLTALVNTESEDPVAGTRDETLRAFLTFAPRPNRAGRRRVPPLRYIGADEKALFTEVEARLELHRVVARQRAAG